MARKKGKPRDLKPQAAADAGEKLSPAGKERTTLGLLCAGMTALFVARPLFPSESAAHFGDGLGMVMLWLALAVFWLLWAVGRPTFSLRFGCVDAAVLCLVVWQTAAALWAVGHGGAPRPAINMLWEWVGMGLSFFLARQLVATARESRALVAVMAALAVAMAVHALYQYGVEMPLVRAEFEAHPERAMQDTGLNFAPGSVEMQQFENRLKSREPTSAFALANSLAGLLAPWMVALAGVGLAAASNKKRLLGIILLLVPIAGCLLLTKSRSAWLAAGVGLLLAWLTCRQRTMRIGWKIPAAAGALAAILIAGAVAVGGLDREVLSQAGKSFSYRLQYWTSSLELIAEHPIVGCGPGNFQNAYTQYKLPEASEEVADPHNFLMEVWATGGTPALTALLAALGCFAVRTWKRNISNAHPEPNDPLLSADNTQYILGGGVFGFLLSVPMGLLSEAPPGLMTVLLGLPVAVVAVLVLSGWIREGRLPRLLPAVGVAVLLVNLLAAGGIAFPGVAGSLWLLMALGLQGEPRRELRKFAAWGSLAVALGLTVACYFSAYNPVMKCQTAMRRAERDRTHAAEHLEAAAAADPWDAMPWRKLAAVEFDTWRVSPTAEQFERFERADAEALRRSPQCASAWLTSGDFYQAAWSQSNAEGRRIAGDLLGKAIAAYRRAVQLYPNRATYRAKLAEAYLDAGDAEQFRREAEAALRLDKITPHADKKLPPETRDQLQEKLSDDL